MKSIYEMATSSYEMATSSTARSDTIGVNVVTKRSKKGVNVTSTINIYKDGRSEDSVVVPGEMSLGKALIYVGTRMLMEDK